EKFFRVSIASEKEVILIVAKATEKAAIMQSIVQGAGVGTEAGAVVLSLPVTAVAGFGMLDNN
ncbi:MAG: P-II family nitrogen regulator, partial [Clostridia bacterium]|nr:P-II family nitrogen regulator [Clostridia bacterium]